MEKYNVQYSVCGVNTNPAISEWPEKTKIIEANSDKEAIEKFEHNREGTWMILDCWEV